MTLPPEVLDYILGFLKSDKTTLKACFRSYPTLSRLVERHLYSNVAIEHPTMTCPDDFLAVLTHRPHIVNYVRALEIRFGNFIQDPNAFLEEISLILPKLSMLRRIVLASANLRTYNWQMMPERFRLAFSDCLRLPSMMDISTEYIAFPLSILNQCKHIGSLSLRGWDEVSSDKIYFPTIDSLALHGCGATSLYTIVSWIQSRRLSSLEFSDNVYGVAFNFLSHILIRCSHSLTNLDVDIGGRFASHYVFGLSNGGSHPDGAILIPLSVLQNLQHLTIRSQLTCTDTRKYAWVIPGFASPILAITDVLKSASSLKRLTLDFHSSITVHDYQKFERHITDILCTSIHSLLVQSASAIESINLQVNSMQKPDFVTPNVITSLFLGHPDLRQFIENGKLILVDQQIDYA